MELAVVEGIVEVELTAIFNTHFYLVSLFGKIGIRTINRYGYHYAQASFARQRSVGHVNPFDADNRHDQNSSGRYPERITDSK